MLLAWAIPFILRSETEFHKMVTYIRMNEWMDQSHTVFQTLQICNCLWVPVLNQGTGTWWCMGGSRRIPPRIFNVDTKWGWVVIFTPRSLHPRGKGLPVPCVRPKASPDVLLLLPGIEPRLLGCPFRSLVTVPSEPSLHIAMKNNALFFLFCPVLNGTAVGYNVQFWHRNSWNSDSELVPAVWIPQVGLTCQRRWGSNSNYYLGRIFFLFFFF